MTTTGERRGLSSKDGHEELPICRGPRHVSLASLSLRKVSKQINPTSAYSIIDNISADADMAAPNVSARGKPRLLLMGQKRSGKSSISSVVFHKMPPQETLFLESTARIQKDAMLSFMDFQVWDFPGQLDFNSPEFDVHAIFGEIGALIYVIDAQDDYADALARLTRTVLELQPLYPDINVEVFIHKCDGVSDDYKLDVRRDIIQRVSDELSDHGYENPQVSYYLTSIYDHTIFEAFSKVIQKLIPHLASLEALLNELSRACHFEKVYLFDVLSKIYIATDSSPMDMSSYEICSDFIDVVVDISEIYAWDRPQEYLDSLEGPPYNQKLEDQMASPDAEAQIILRDGGRPIILKEVNKYLCIVAVGKEDSYEKSPQVMLNIEATIAGLRKVFELTKRKAVVPTTAEPSAKVDSPHMRASDSSRAMEKQTAARAVAAS